MTTVFYDEQGRPEPPTAAVERSRAVAARLLSEDPRTLDTTHPAKGRRTEVSVRWILTHMIEEYARNSGHADLLREQIDGQTGNEAPACRLPDAACCALNG